MKRLDLLPVAVQESRRCVVSVTTEAQFMSSSSSTSSDVNSVSSCGSKSHPWRLEAAAGQRINISLLDFTAMDRPRDRVTCRQYGYVLEKMNKRNVSVCGGGGAQLRQSHVYMSDSSHVQIVQNPSRPTSDNDQSYLIRIEGKCILLFTPTRYVFDLVRPAVQLSVLMFVPCQHRLARKAQARHDGRRPACCP